MTAAASFQFELNTTPGEPPGQSQLRLDNADPTLATRVWCDANTINGADVMRALLLWPTGARAYIQDWDDHLNYELFELSAEPVDKASYVELPVTHVESGQPIQVPPKTDVALVMTEAPTAPEPTPPAGLSPYALCTVEEVVAMLKLTDRPPDPDEVVNTINAASRAIQLYAKRLFANPVSDVRLYAEVPQQQNGSWYLSIDDAVDVTLVSDSGTDPVAEITFLERPADPEPGWPYTGLLLSSLPYGPVAVEGTFGWPAIPDDIHYAAVQQSAAWYTFDSSRLSDSWADELGPQARAPAPLPKSLLYAVRDLVRPYRRVSMG